MRYFVVLLLVLVSSACSKQEEQAAPALQQQDSRARQTQAASSNVNDGILPGGVQLSTPVHLRSDKASKTKAGATRRRVVYELLGVGPAEALQAVSSDFERAGYTAGKRTEGKDGKYTVLFGKQGEKSLNVLFYPDIGKSPAHADARSRIAVGWEVKKAPKKAGI